MPETSGNSSETFDSVFCFARRSQEPLCRPRPSAGGEPVAISSQGPNIESQNFRKQRAGGGLGTYGPKPDKIRLRHSTVVVPLNSIATAFYISPSTNSPSTQWISEACASNWRYFNGSCYHLVSSIVCCVLIAFPFTDHRHPPSNPSLEAQSSSSFLENLTVILRRTWKFSEPFGVKRNVAFFRKVFLLQCFSLCTNLAFLSLDCERIDQSTWQKKKFFRFLWWRFVDEWVH